VPLAAIATATDEDFAPETMLFDDIPVIVSATRTEESLLDVPNSVTVITDDEIRASGATSLPELLEVVPGLDMMRISRSDVNMSARGFNAATSSNMLVMIDGRSVYLDFFGVVLWERLNVSLTEIERIEVVRGPSSAFYGANAFLGTVNIVTKRARELPNAQVWSGIGPRGAFMNATGARSFGASSVKGSASYDVRDQFRNSSSPVPNAMHRRGDTGMRARRFNGSFERDLTDGGQLRVSGGMSNLKGDLFSQVGTWDYLGPEYYTQVALERGPWRLQTFITHSDLDVSTVPLGLPVPPLGVSDRIGSTTFDVEAQREIDLGDHHLVLGGNTRRVTTRAPDVLGDREAETLYSGFFQDQYRMTDWMTAFLAARVDDHPHVGLNVSPRVSLLLKPSERSRVWFAFSRAFRSPTHVLNYLSLNLAGYTPLPTPLVTLQGNEDLDPSWATSYEAGFQVFPHRRVSVKADLFYEVITDLTQIVAVAPGPPVVQSFRNVGRMTNWGGETWIEFKQSDALRGFAGYSFQQPSGDFEQISPRHKASAGLRGAIGRLHYALTGIYVAHTDYEETSPMLLDTHIPSRFQVDSYLGVQLAPQFELGLRARNVFNQVRPQFPLGDDIGGEFYLTGRLEF
jgi:iron complex outermembrane receptor protein